MLSLRDSCRRCSAVVVLAIAAWSVNALSAEAAHTISGRVLDESGTGIAGITLCTINGNNACIVTSAPTQGDGTYRLPNLKDNRAYNIRVTIDDRSANYVFMPTQFLQSDYAPVLSAKVALATADINGIDFVKRGVSEALDGFTRPLWPYNADNYGYTYQQHANYVDKDGNPVPGWVYHPGQDYNSKDNEPDTYPIYAVADGVVVDIRPPSTPRARWGGIVIKHWYRNAAVYSQYGHLSIDRDVQTIGVQQLQLGEFVKKGAIIGYEDTIGVKPPAQHLHFEIRTSAHPRPYDRNYFEGDASGAALSINNPDNVAKWYVHPDAFLESATAANEPFQIIVDERERSVTGEAVAAPTKWFVGTPSSSFQHVEPDNEAGDGRSRGFGGHMQYVTTTSSAATTSGSWKIDLATPGTYDVYAFIPRCWHEKQVCQGPTLTSQSAYYKLDGVSIATVDQSAQKADAWVLLQSGHNLSAGVHELTLDNATGETGRELAFDAVKLVRRGELGTAVPNPVVTQTVVLTPGPPYTVGQTIAGAFTITNRGAAAIGIDRLLLGGRLNGDLTCAGGCPDFSSVTSIQLAPSGSFSYTGTLRLMRAGNYSFFAAYLSGAGAWVTNVPTDYGVANTASIDVDGGTLPHIDYISPTTTTPKAFDLSIYGTNFGLGSIDQVYWKDSGALVGNGTVTSASGTKIVVREYMTGALPGIYQVRVKTADGRLSNPVDLVLTDSADFSITASPTARSITQGSSTTFTATVRSLNGFSNPVKLEAINLPPGYVTSGTSWTPSTVTPSSDGTATGILSVATDSASSIGTFLIGLRGVSGDVVHDTSVSLTINSSTGPVVKGISPETPPPSPTDQNVRVSGSRFRAGLTVDVFNNSGVKIGTLSGTQILNVVSTSFTMVVNLGVSPATFGMEVVNPDGQRSPRFTFSTVAAAPSISSISPNPVPTFGGNQNVSVSGTNFQAGLTVDVFNSSGVRIGTLSGTQILNVTSTSFTMVVNLGASPGAFGIEVVNPDGKRSTPYTFATTEPTCVAPPAGLVGWWPGDGNTHDLVAGNNGAPVGAATFDTGKVRSAFKLDGVTGHVRIPDADNLDFTNAMTVDAWIYPTATASAFPTIVSKWDAIEVHQRSYTLDLEASGRVIFKVTPNGDEPGFPGNLLGTVISNRVVRPEEWSHIAGVYDGQFLRVYVNGEQDNQVAYNLGIFRGTDDVAIGATVGGTPTTQAVASFVGLIDEVDLFNRALSGNEIAAIFSAGGGGKCAAGLPPTVVAPTVTGIQPSAIVAGVNDQSVMLSGTGFQQGLTISVGLPGGSTSTLSGTQIPSVVPSTIGALVTFGSPGTYTFTVINPDGGTSAPFSVSVSARSILTLSTLMNTGGAPESQPDPNYVLLTGPTCPVGNCTVIAAPDPDNGAVSKWIRTAGGDPSASTDPAGQYVFRLEFNLTDTEALTGIITGRWATDDWGRDILINGRSTRQRADQTFAYSSFVLAGGFQPGLNTLDFVVENQNCGGCVGNPVGLRVELTGRATSATSLPTLTELPNTGAAGSGLPDPYYAVVSGPTCPIGVCQAVISGGDSTSRLISPTPDSTHPGGQYIYRLGFAVSEGQAPLAQIHGRWAVDDAGTDILINGVSTGLHTSQSSVFSPLSITTGFRPGVNTLDFVTQNQNCGACVGNPTSLRVELAGTTTAGVVTPTLTGIQPSRIVAGPNDQNVLLSGTGFQQGLTISVGLPGGSTSTLSGTQILNVSPTSISALATFGSAGTYTFTVVNPDGGASVPFSVSIVTPATPTLVYEDGDPMVAFGPPVVDSTGALYVTRTRYGFACGFGFCDSELQKIVVGGNGWLGQPLGDALNPAQIVLGPSGRVFFQGNRDVLYAYESDGSLSLGLWPVQFGSNGPTIRTITIDSTSGEVFAVARTGGSCFDSCFQYLKALRPDGSEMWSLVNNSGLYVTLGPGRDAYVWREGQMIRVDRETGLEVCRTPVSNGANWIGTDLGLFALEGTGVRRFASDCTISDVLDLGAATSRTLFAYNEAWLFGSEYTGSIQQNDLGQLFGTSVDGHTVWRQDQISPNAFPVKAIVNAQLYVLGLDKTDGMRQKLFVVGGTTGEIRFRVDLTGTCQNCGVGVAADGTVYVNDLNSAKIFRIQP